MEDPPGYVGIANQVYSSLLGSVCCGSLSVSGLLFSELSTSVFSSFTVASSVFSAVVSVDDGAVSEDVSVVPAEEVTFCSSAGLGGGLLLLPSHGIAEEVK